MSTAAEPKRTDLEEICKSMAEGKKVDSELAKRARERSDAIRRKFDGPSSAEILRSVREE
jgi:hypothetical protein